MVYLCIIFMLVYIGIQDLKYRAIYLFCFPIMLILFVWNAFLFDEFSYSMIFTNILMFIIQYALLVFYFWFWKGVSLMKNEIWIGWGDLAFFMVLTTAFSTINLLVFQIFSLSLIWFGVKIFGYFGYASKSIPLAGFQAIILAIILLMDFDLNGQTFYKDLI